MVAKPKIKVVVDGDRVVVSGNTADVHIDVQVVAQRVAVTNNAFSKRWHETWWGISLLGVTVTVASGGFIYWIGWT